MAKRLTRSAWLGLMAALLPPLAGCGALGAPQLAGPGLAPVPVRIAMLHRVPLPPGFRLAQLEDARWNLLQIGAVRIQAGSYDLSPGRAAAPAPRGGSCVVAVLDTGVDPDHPDLAGRLYPLIDAVGPDAAGGTDYTGRDGNGHGTHVAGLAAQVGGAGVRVLPVKVIAASGEGNDAQLVAGIDRALAWRAPDTGARVRVLNLSLSSPMVSQRLVSAIGRARDAGCLVVAAAGNDGGPLNFPANLAGVVAVGATTREGEHAGYSCEGAGLALSAPGGDDAAPVYSTWPGYLTFADRQDGVSRPHLAAGLTGTSMATPHVSGSAAALWAAEPGLAVETVRRRLLALATDAGEPGPDPAFGYGRLNLAGALETLRHDGR